MGDAVDKKSASQDELETRVKLLEEQLKTMIDRNIRVEADKAWEISNTRRLSIVVITYLMMALFLSVIGVSNPALNAVIPTLGYLLSTLYLGTVKDVWIRMREKST